MFLTLVWDEIENPREAPRFITFEGTPTQVQAECNGFVAGGIIVRGIVLIGSK